MSFLNLKKLLTKILQNIRKLPNYYSTDGDYSTRPTSANIDSDNSGGVIQFLSTGNMTEGKPTSDGNILHFNWDNSNKWASQLAIPHGEGGFIQWRAQKDGTTWKEWHDVWYDPVEISANTDLNTYKYPSTRYCPGNAIAATLSNCPTTAAFFLYVEKANRPDTATTDTYQYYTQTIKDIDGKVYVRKIQNNNGTWTYGTWGNGVVYIANNLTTANAGEYVLDAYQGKVLNDKFGSYATTSSLSNYLPKSGGTATGNITVNHSDTTESDLRVQNSAANGVLYAGSNGTFGLYNSKLGHGLITENSSGTVSIHGWTNRGIANNLTTTSTGSVLDAYQGYVLNNKLTVETQEFAAASYSKLSAACYARRVGRVGILFISTLTGLTASGTTDLFTISAKYRPATAVTQDCLVAGATPACVRITINTSGLVQAYNYSTSTGARNIRANIVYVCAG